MNWLYYLAEANLYLCVFYLAYCIFFSKETHYQLNRFYLLFSCLAAFVLPLVQVNALKPPVVQKVQVFDYTALPTTESVAIIKPVEPAKPILSSLTFDNFLMAAYVAGALIVLVILIVKLYSIFKLTHHKKATYGNYNVVYLDDTETAFSFFNYLFVGTTAAGTDTIITHEMVHIRQRHSADIMFLELIKVMCWFNPVVYLLQNSLKTIHEYIADEKAAAADEDTIAYSTFLLNNAYGTGGLSITHSFFNYNLLKKRIIMLNQQRSGNLARLKYLITLPACAGMLCASTLAFSKTYGWHIGKMRVETETNGNLINLHADTLKTKKGYKYSETIYTKDGVKRATVTFYEDGGKKTSFNSAPMSPATANLLIGKYGYMFPNGTMPPPPPAPREKVGKIKFPPPVLKDKNGKLLPMKPMPKVDQVKFPPPPTGNLKTSSTGYQYEETGYLVRKTQNYRVIIHEKDGEQKEYYKSTAKKADLKLLKEKYGYVFPDMQLYDQLPPPPPSAPENN
ncbi:M56 family metallopeptidase [Mucilaginibacter auburnensis]|uniref:BlaR1 peptidase M56 n=1 Tax=Mucilaginibacter auburnensis TaxID=1457233 RepID=A0A2H9VL78_9SPHI|nr:M56 family metallopeptidase [Mucilaginibacter auburnensis]PJJ79097.1 BlaR1 peptidase M56 [Mucilaginibacter auburnensis]